MSGLLLKKSLTMYGRKNVFMKSCDKLVCSKMLKNITYDDMTLFGGIANNLRYFEYEKQNIYFPDGRGYVDFTKLLSSMEVNYEILSVSQLSQYKDAKNIVVFVPKEILDNMEIMKNNVTGIYLVYSAFFVKKIKKDSLVLCIEYDKFTYERELKFSELDMISKYKSKPLNYVVKIIRIDVNKQNDKSLLISTLKHNLTDFINISRELSEGSICIKGPVFYDNMEDVLKKLLYNQSKENRIKLFIFSSTLNAGGEAFYRHDFLESILSYNLMGKNKDIDCAIDMLVVVQKMWYELARILRFAQKNIESVNVEAIVKLLKKIKKMELETVNILLLNFEILGECICYGK